MPRRSEIGRDSAFVLGSKFLGLSVFVASRGVSPYRERGQPLLGLLPSAPEYGAASGLRHCFPVMHMQRHSWFSGTGRKSFLGTWVCDRGAVVNIEESKLISMIQIDFVHQSSDYLTAYHVFYLGREESCSRR
jgi:hypothetical protein